MKGGLALRKVEERAIRQMRNRAVTEIAIGALFLAAAVALIVILVVRVW